MASIPLMSKIDYTDFFFSIKTKTPKTVKEILEKSTAVEFSQLNVHQDKIKIGTVVFIVLGGDKGKAEVTWQTGLQAIGVVTKEPYDLAERNFKIIVKINVLLSSPISRQHLISYLDTFGIIGIGPISSWEPNQALSRVDFSKAIALLRAMLDFDVKIDTFLKNMLPSEIYTKILEPVTRLQPVQIPYGASFSFEFEKTIKSLTTNNEETYEFEPYSKELFLSEVFIDETEYDTLVALLRHKKNIILEGAPGVGKTFLAKRLAYSLLGYKDDSHLSCVQFHQSYGYEDFVSGYRPTESGFTLGKGPFYEFCEKARHDSSDYFFIIDEINRGNLSKILGELLMLIEADHRDEKIKTIYGIDFSVPKNIYIIGMMNTADRSIALLDYALRRRFSFYKLHPAFNSSKFLSFIDNFDNEKVKSIISVINLLNLDIAQDESLGEGFQIGHSYFCNENIDDVMLQHIVKFEIIPLINEYWFDDKEIFDNWSKKLLDALL